MRRAVGLLLVFAVSLASAGALVAAAVTLPSPPDRSTAGAATVRRFYAAVNDALRTSTPPALDGVVVSALLRPAGRPAGGPGADVLGEIDRLRAAFTGREIRIEALVADRTGAVARVAVDGGRRDPTTGLSVHGPTMTWRAVDWFRLDEGRIVAFERWEPDAAAASARPLFETTLDRPPSAPVAVEANRVTLPPSAHLPGLVGPGPELLLLEAGVLSVRFPRPAQRGGASGGTTVEGEVALRSGDLLVVPTGVPFTIENAGPVPAVVLAVALRPTAPRSPENDGIDASALAPAALVPSVAIQRLAQGLAADLPTGPATVAAARLTLAPGAGIAPHEVAGAELLAVEAGTLDLAVSAGGDRLAGSSGAEQPAAPATRASGIQGPGPDGTLTAGEGALLPAGTSDAARNVGADPVELLVVRIASAEPAAG